MTEIAHSQPNRRKTPEDATPFEREQLRFLLSDENLGATLETINPSLAWLPVFYEMKLIKNEGELASWIERNFSDVNAVRDVVSNIRFFGPDSANVLEFRLNNHIAQLSKLLVRCWTLIIRHMRNQRHGIPEGEWFDVLHTINRGIVTADLIDRVVNVLRPKLTLSKRITFRQDDAVLEHPSDLMSIDFEIEDGLSANDVVSVWFKHSTPDTDEKLLDKLTAALSATLDDAVEIGVEGNEGYSLSDSDVPSVAVHEQNAHRSGFQVIVRVMVELWDRLAQQAPSRANIFVEKWKSNHHRLIRRLALFAAANNVVSADSAANILLTVPVGELFLTNSSVEAYRLIRSRWNEFLLAKQSEILSRLRDGPPIHWFRQDADVDKAVDRSRFDVLGNMERDGYALDVPSKELLEHIRTKYPYWQLRPSEQAGFHIWHESSSELIGDAGKLEAVTDAQLISVARDIVKENNFFEGESWRAFVISRPQRALNGLELAANGGDWPENLWQQFLWESRNFPQELSERVAQLLLRWPVNRFEKISGTASAWLEEHTKLLENEVLWSLWDKIAAATFNGGNGINQ